MAVNERKQPRKKQGSKAWAWAVLALGLIPALLRPASAASSATITIDVTVNAPLSVSVDGSGSSTHTAVVTPGGSPVVAASTATVLNDSVGLNEFWKLSSDDAFDQVTEADGWSLVTSTSGASAPDADQFAIQAVFISSNAAADACTAVIPASMWDEDYAAPLTAAPQPYSSSLFADQTLIGGTDGMPDFTAGGSDGRMRRDSQRGLCWRIVPPDMVTTDHDQIIAITVTAGLTP